MVVERAVVDEAMVVDVDSTDVDVEESDSEPSSVVDDESVDSSDSTDVDVDESDSSVGVNDPEPDITSSTLACAATIAASLSSWVSKHATELRVRELDSSAPPHEVPRNVTTAAAARARTSGDFMDCLLAFPPRLNDDLLVVNRLATVCRRQPPIVIAVPMADVDLALALQRALSAADRADAVTFGPFTSRSFVASQKADKTDVTDIDRAAEDEITRALSTDGDVAILGEEHGRRGASNGSLWVVDPIDGTSNFVRGVPVWATLIALVDDGAPVLGVVSAPALGRRWWASHGGGAYVNGQRLGVSTTSVLSEAHISVTPSRGWTTLGLDGALLAIQRQAKRARGFGDFWQHMLVAEGAIDVAIDAVGLQPYDNAAIYPIVSESGGTITDRFGRSDWTADTMVSTNGLLHREVIEHMKGASRG